MVWCRLRSCLTPAAALIWHRLPAALTRRYLPLPFCRTSLRTVEPVGMAPILSARTSPV